MEKREGVWVFNADPSLLWVSKGQGLALEMIGSSGGDVAGHCIWPQIEEPLTASYPIVQLRDDEFLWRVRGSQGRVCVSHV